MDEINVDMFMQSERTWNSVSYIRHIPTCKIIWDRKKKINIIDEFIELGIIEEVL